LGKDGLAALLTAIALGNESSKDTTNLQLGWIKCSISGWYEYRREESNGMKRGGCHAVYSLEV